jgi:hypothetical protein
MTDPVCRYCLDAEPAEQLFSPCRCAGSLAVVHRHCFESWRAVAPDPARCELCHWRYATDWRRRLLPWLLAVLVTLLVDTALATCFSEGGWHWPAPVFIALFLLLNSKDHDYAYSITILSHSLSPVLGVYGPTPWSRLMSAYFCAFAVLTVAHDRLGPPPIIGAPPRRVGGEREGEGD